MDRVRCRWPAALLALLSLLLAACASTPIAPTVMPTAATRAELRIKNNGPTPIQGLIVIFPDSRVEFGDIPAGATTGYKPVPGGVYRYAAYHVIIDGKPLDQPVVDWVGEQPVPGTAFTYVLDVDPARSFPNVVMLVQATVDR